MGLYRKKGSPFWWISFRVEGRRFFESTGTKKKGLAERIFSRRLEEALEDGPENDRRRRPKVPFGELAADYLSFTERQRSFKSKAGFVKTAVLYFGCLPVGSFSVADVEGFQTALIKKGNAPATVNRHLSALKHMFTKAVEWEMVEEEVLKKVRRVKQLRETNRRLRFLSRAESSELVRVAAPHLKPVIVTALNTGMRKGEILGLRWEQVDFRLGLIHLENTKNGETRQVPMNETVRLCLKGVVRRIKSPWVFCDKEGRRWLDVKKGFSSACRRARIKDFRFHDLRHTFASNLVMAGVDIMTVKELLGHKTLAMTLRYSHLAPGHKLRAVEVLDGDNMVTLEKKGFTAFTVNP